MTERETKTDRETTTKTYKDRQTETQTDETDRKGQTDRDRHGRRDRDGQGQRQEMEKYEISFLRSHHKTMFFPLLPAIPKSASASASASASMTSFSAASLAAAASSASAAAIYPASAAGAVTCFGLQSRGCRAANPTANPAADASAANPDDAASGRTTKMSNFLCPSDFCPISDLSNTQMSKTAMSNFMSNYLGILAISRKTDEFEVRPSVKNSRID